MRILKYLTLVASLLWSLPSVALPEAGSATRKRLANGIEVVLRESHRQREVAILVAYDVGSRDDPRELPQLAHLVEHMTYGGSRHLGAFEGASVLEALGAHHLNGTTSLDRTVYQAVVPANALASALWVESERMAFTLERFDAASIERERAAVANELRLRSAPQELMDQLLWQAVFGPQHPYWPSLTAKPDLPLLTLQHTQWFYQTHYLPERAKLVLVGDFETSSALALVEKYFAPIRGAAAPLARAAVPLLSRFAAHDVTLEIPTIVAERLVKLYPAPRRFTREDAALAVFARALVQRLRGRLQQTSPLASSVRGARDCFDAGCFFGIDVQVAVRNRFDEVEQVVKDETVKTWSLDFAALVPGLRRGVELEVLSALEHPLWLAEAELSALTQGGEPFEAARYLEYVRAVTASNVLALRPYFSGDRVDARLKLGRVADGLPPNGRVTVK